MGWQCVPQIKGLVRGDGMRKDGKGQAKHRANAAGIIHEAFEIKDQNDGHPIPIRKSKSETYDKSRTINNRYTGFRAADDVVDALEEEAARHPVKVQVRDKETGEIVVRERALREDAVIGIAVIFNPPCEVARYWTQEQYEKFFRDCEEVMAQIPCCKMDKKGRPVGEEHYLFRKENLIAGAEHWDEGERTDPPVFTGHKHDIYIPADQDGEYHGKMIDALFLSVMVNRNFARMMREREWDIDDPDFTDWDQFDGDRAYKSKRKTKIKQGGKPVNNFIADKRLAEAEATLEEAGTMMEQAAAIVEESKRKDRESEAKVLTAEAEKNRLLLEASVAESARDKALDERATAISEKDQAVEAAQLAAREKEQADADADAAYQEQQRLRMGNNLLDKMQTSARKELGALEKKRDAARAEIQGLQAEITASRKERDSLKSEMAAAEAGRDNARAEADELRRTKVRQAREAAAAERTRIMAEIEKEAAEKRERAEARQKELDDAIAVAQDTLDALQKKIEGLQELVRKAEQKAQNIVEIGKRTAASIRAAAEGEHKFLVEFFGNEPFIFKKGEHAGKSYLEYAREKYEQALRKERLKDMPDSVKGAGKSRQTGADGPTGPGT